MFDVKVAQDFMRRKLVTLSTDTNVIDGVARLLKDNISGAPVIDDSGQLPWRVQRKVLHERADANRLKWPTKLGFRWPASATS